MATNMRRKDLVTWLIYVVTLPKNEEALNMDELSSERSLLYPGNG